MPKNTAVLEETQPAEPIKPELLAKLKKEDMRAAVVERFRTSADKPANRATARVRSHSQQDLSPNEGC